MSKKLFLFMTLFIFGIHTLAMDIDYADDIDAAEAAEMVKEDDALIVDVRDPREFLYAGHIPGSVNIPIFFVRIELPPLKTRIKISNVEKKRGLSLHVKKIYQPLMDENKNFVHEVKEALAGDLEKPVILICRSGERSIYAARKLSKNGFENVYNIEKGFLFDWKASGLQAGGE